MTPRSSASENQRLQLMCEAIRLCQRARAMGLAQSAWSKLLRESIHYIWELRLGTKGKGAQFRSVAASGLRWGKNEIRYDHAIPFVYLKNELMNLDEVRPTTVREILETWRVCCIITREEDGLLKKSGLGSRMPGDWDGHDPLARYKAVGIEIVANTL